MREETVGSSDAMDGKRDTMGKNCPDLFYLRAGKQSEEREMEDGKGAGRASVASAEQPKRVYASCLHLSPLLVLRLIPHKYMRTSWFSPALSFSLYFCAKEGRM
jgi:hypothetical protein